MIVRGRKDDWELINMWAESWQPSKVVTLGTWPTRPNVFLTRGLNAQLEVINFIEAHLGCKAQGVRRKASGVGRRASGAATYPPIAATNTSGGLMK